MTGVATLLHNWALSEEFRKHFELSAIGLCTALLGKGGGESAIIIVTVWRDGLSADELAWKVKEAADGKIVASRVPVAEKPWEKLGISRSAYYSRKGRGKL